MQSTEQDVNHLNTEYVLDLLVGLVQEPGDPVSAGRKRFLSKVSYLHHATKKVENHLAILESP